MYYSMFRQNIPSLFAIRKSGQFKSVFYKQFELGSHRILAPTVRVNLLKNHVGQITWLRHFLLHIE